MEYYPVFSPPTAGFRIRLFIKRLLYYVCKYIGLFALAGYVTRRGLRIISYHGCGLEDECDFSPHTFIDPSRFEKRMQFLVENQFAVLSLDDALDLLDSGDLPDRSVVITIDDGFYSTFRLACPVLRARNLPATIYITTYYAKKGNPVFRLLVQYMLWKTDRTEVGLDGLGAPLSGTARIGSNREKGRLVQELIGFGENHCSEEERYALAKEVGRRLDVDYDAIAKSRKLSLMNEAEIEELSKASFDIELHSHRHRFPQDREMALREITENRSILEPLTGRRLKHFCYPSGIYSQAQWPYLSEAGMRSAVTTDRGLNFRETRRYALKRFGDGDVLSQIEFEAEIYGFAVFVRAPLSSLKSSIRRTMRRNNP